MGNVVAAVDVTVLAVATILLGGDASLVVASWVFQCDDDTGSSDSFANSFANSFAFGCSFVATSATTFSWGSSAPSQTTQNCILLSLVRMRGIYRGDDEIRG